MATHAACAGSIKIKSPNGATFESAIEISSWNRSIAKETKKRFVIGSCDAKFSAGTKEKTYSFEGLFDPASPEYSAIEENDVVEMELYPVDDNSLHPGWYIVLTIDSVEMGGSAEEDVTFTFSGSGTDTLIGS